ncbi:MAG: leucine--tRNA ligase [Candidatus Geothermarchaeales archaeon]
MGVSGVEEKWVHEWERAKIFEADPRKGVKKFFVTVPYPYMNGPLHLGHGFTGTRPDVIARYKRMKGYNVLFPWAWHWTGEAVMGISDRIKKNDPTILKTLRELDRVPEEEIERFVDPEYLVRYYTEQNRDIVKRIGFSVDWRREFHTTSLHPGFSKFVEWQIRRLAERGYIRKGTHPVVWCPHCVSPTGDHDRLEGVGVRPEEFVLLKFRLGDAWLVAGTFRPETVFGVTNIWINPDSKYALASVDGERWILSVEAAQKLREQLRRVDIIREMRGRDLIGKKVRVPLVEVDSLILPGPFVDTGVASGVVYSVPAHAPIDWLALRDLKENKEEIERYGLDEGEVEEITPISIIRVEGFGDFPAIEVVDQLKVKDQLDPKGEEATEIVYSKEYHKGVMKDNCAEFASLPVQVAKDRVKEKMVGLGLTSTMYDLPREVICRCGTHCVAKIIEDQWFLKYSDEEWKERCRRHVGKMIFYPEEARQMFLHYIDWFHDWPCTRKTGLGTPFPLDPEWIVETLTDSTVYMAFYIIGKYYNSGEVSEENLNDDFFNYVFLGEGGLTEVSEKTGLPIETLERIRGDYLYWYPVDLRASGKDLVGNHLTFFIFHHTAVFHEEDWPQAISVNGYVRLEGSPMSKSRGVFVSLRDAIEEFGADATRLSLILGAEGLEDPDWRRTNAEVVSNRIKAIPSLVKSVLERAQEGEKGFFEKLLLSKLQGKIERVEQCLEEAKTASAARVVFYDMFNDLQEYARISPAYEMNTLRYYIETWVKMLQPFTPFLAEEMWRTSLEKTGFVSQETWPRVREELIYPQVERRERYVHQLIDDLREVVKALPIEVNRAYLYVAEGWKWTLLEATLKSVDPTTKRVDFSRVIEEVRKKHPDVEASTIAKMLKTLVKRPWVELVEQKSLMEAVGGPDEEAGVIVSIASRYVGRGLGVELHVQREGSASYDPKERASRAMPLKPGIYVE